MKRHDPPTDPLTVASWVLLAVAVILVLASCRAATAPTSHQWVVQFDGSRKPHEFCVCVEPSHASDYIGVDREGRAITGHVVRIADEQRGARTDPCT